MHHVRVLYSRVVSKYMGHGGAALNGRQCCRKHTGALSRGCRQMLWNNPWINGVTEWFPRTGSWWWRVRTGRPQLPLPISCPPARPSWPTSVANRSVSSFITVGVSDPLDLCADPDHRVGKYPEPALLKTVVYFLFISKLTQEDNIGECFSGFNAILIDLSVTLF